MKESKVEKTLKKKVEAAGGLCLKFTCPSLNGVPDRMVLLPDGHFAFVETKAPGKKPRPLQLHVHNLFRRLGQHVYVLDNIENVDAVIFQILHHTKGAADEL